jgi:hypothetical protein
MTPVWLIEADAFGRTFEPLRAEMRQQGIPSEIVQPGPFLNGVMPTVGGHRLTAGECVVFSGTYPLMRHIQLHVSWTPGGWCTAESFDCRTYYPHFSPYLLNASHAILSIDEALSSIDDLFARFGREDQVFVRPVGVQKTFTGRCEDREGLTLTLQSARYANIPILIAAPQVVSDEWRVVVSERGFLAASQYRAEGEIAIAPGCPSAVREFLEGVLAAVPFQPDPIYMIDVGIAEDRLRVIELNSFSCSGLYACDPAAVVGEVKRLAVAAYEASRSSGGTGR